MALFAVKRAGAVLVATALLAMVAAGCLGGEEEEPNSPPSAKITLPLVGTIVEAGEAFQLDGSQSSDEDNDQLQYFWVSNLEPGKMLAETATATVSLEVVGDHLITLTVADPKGAEDKDSVAVKVKAANQPPSAVISSPREGQRFSTGESITFDGRNSFDDDEGDDIDSHKWLVDDVLTSFDDTFTKVLSEGPHRVELIVEDTRGATDSTKVNIEVRNLPPRAVISWPKAGQTYYPGDQIKFDGSNSTDPEEGQLSFEWDFDDGSPAESEAVVFHAYENPGQYRVTLSAFDDEDQINNATVLVTIDSLGPTASFTANNTTPRVDENVTFDAGDSEAPEGATLTNYHWDFGDGNETDTENATIEHNWTGPGNYTVTLTVIDSNENTNETSMVMQIIPKNYTWGWVSGGLILAGGSDDSSFAFPIEIFVYNISVNVTLSKSGGEVNFSVNLKNNNGQSIWSYDVTITGGEQDERGTIFNRSQIGPNFGDNYVLEIHAENQSLLTPADTDIQAQITVIYRKI